MFKYKLPA